MTTLRSLLESLFCDRIRRELLKQEKILVKLMNDNLKLTADLIDFQVDYDKLEKEKEELSLKTFELAEQIKELTHIIGNAVILPDVSKWTQEYGSFSPWDYPWSIGDIAIGDKEYYTFSKDDWHEILRIVHPNVKAIYTRWLPEKADCENHSELMSALVHATLAQTELDLQGAFMIAWSRSHAYNLYVDSENQIWVYEPQNGSDKGLMSEAEGAFLTRKIWFMG